MGLYVSRRCCREVGWLAFSIWSFCCWSSIVPGWSPLTVESLEIAQPRFRKFNCEYIENIKIVRPISRLCDTNFPHWGGASSESMIMKCSSN